MTDAREVQRVIDVLVEDLAEDESVMPVIRISAHWLAERFLAALSEAGLTVCGEQATQAIERLYWFVRMVTTGGPDGTDLDAIVHEEGMQAADWLNECNYFGWPDAPPVIQSEEPK